MRNKNLRIPLGTQGFVTSVGVPFSNLSVQIEIKITRLGYETFAATIINPGSESVNDLIISSCISKVRLH